MVTSWDFTYTGWNNGDFENNVLAHETMLAVVCAMKGSFLSHPGPSTNAPASCIQNPFQTPYRCNKNAPALGLRGHT